jgi:hypothetical protein
MKKKLKAVTWVHGSQEMSPPHVDLMNTSNLHLKDFSGTSPDHSTEQWSHLLWTEMQVHETLSQGKSLFHMVGLQFGSAEVT